MLKNKTEHTRTHNIHTILYYNIKYFRRSIPHKHENCKWRVTTILKRNIECTHIMYLLFARARRLLAATPAVAIALNDLHAGAFNALPWIIYTQIEMSHSCRSSCLSAPTACSKPLTIFCPSICSANRLCSYGNHWALFKIKIQ